MLTFYYISYLSTEMTDIITLHFQQIKSMIRTDLRALNSPSTWVLWDCLHLDPQDAKLLYTALLNVTELPKLEKEVSLALTCIRAWKSEYVDEASAGGMHQLAYLYLTFYYNTSFRRVEIDTIPDDIISRIDSLDNSVNFQTFVDFVRTTMRQMKERNFF